MNSFVQRRKESTQRIECCSLFARFSLRLCAKLLVLSKKLFEKCVEALKGRNVIARGIATGQL